MKIGTTAIPIDELEDHEDIVETAFPQTIIRQVRVPNVTLKYKGYPPNCDPNECTPSSEFPHMKSQVEFFNPIQSLFMKEVHKDNNIVVCGSTSCGKTTIAEMAAAHTLEEERKTNPLAKVAYISPLKALASEKQADWTNPSHAFYKYNIAILTGDFILTDDRKKELAEADIICMSSEMLGSRIRRNKAEKNLFINQIRVLVVDESHLLTTEARGANLEVAIMKFTAVNPQCRVVFLSATMPNVDEMGSWLTLLNKKESTIVKSDYRPVKLNWNWEIFDSAGYYGQIEQNKSLKVIELLNRYRNDKFIVFVHTKKTGRQIMAMLKEAGEEAQFHNADLKYETRNKIETSFRSREPGSLRILVATSTIAWGLNMPARRVIITGLTRGRDMVDPLDVTQMGGRAGRVGLDDAGDVHVLIRNTKMKDDVAFCKTIQPITSKISDKASLAFHLVSEIAEGTVKNKAMALNWFTRSLAHLQKILELRHNTTATQLIDEVFYNLERCGAIHNNTDGTYVASAIGKISSWFYFSPFDVADWKSNFRQILTGAKPTDIDIAWALGHNNTAIGEYKLTEPPPFVQKILDVLTGKGVIIKGGADKHISAMYSLLTGKEAGTPEVDVLAGRYRMDSERIGQAIQMLSTMGKYFEGMPHDYIIHEMPIRLTYGMGDACMDLLVLPGVGRKTAEQIMGRNITTAKQLIVAQTTGTKVLTDKKWEAIKDDVVQVATVGHIAYLKQKLKRKSNGN